jgi:Cu(I)/Ag(I) efflux system membrane protein CusA/SilA
VQVAIGGDPVDEVIEGRARFSIQVRYAREFRENPEAIRNLLIQTPTGATIPLSRVADIEFTNGPPMIRTEEGQISGFVFVDPGEVVISDYVERGQAAIDAHLSMPEGVRMEWTGQYKYMQRAHERLTFVIPITLALVMLLLYLNTRSWVEAFIVILAVPMSLIGAIWLLHILNFQMSVAVWVGLIALAGLDAETGVVMLLYLKLAHKRALESGEEMTPARLDEAIVEGSAKRIRPKLMTVITTGCGLLPLMWSTGPGADAMRRIAAPMVGGLGSSFLLELLIYPVIFAIWKGRARKQPS